MRRNTYMWGKSHSNINVNGKTNWESLRLTKSKQEPHEPIPMHRDRAEEAKRHGAQCQPQNTMGNCMQCVSEGLEGYRT